MTCSGAIMQLSLLCSVDVGVTDVMGENVDMP